MGRPYKRYVYSLAERLGKYPEEIMSYYDNNQILEWMAYDITKIPEFTEKYHQEIDLERQRNLDAEQQAELLKSFFNTLGKE